MSFFFGQFPEGADLSFWGGHFPESEADHGVPPAGAATFAFSLESGVRVTYAWKTGVFKSYSGLERRSNLVADPGQRFEGDAVLVGDQSREARSAIGQYAPLGQPFLLGLPYEALVINQDSPSTTAHVQPTAFSDWALTGGRVVVRHAIGNGHYEFASRVIVSVGADTIELDAPLGTVGSDGAEIMPAFAVLLDPQQGFDRYRPAEPIERWGIRARNAIAGFVSAAIPAELALAAPVTNSGVLDNIILRAQSAGADGNSIVVTQSDDALVGMEVIEDVLAKTLHIKYEGNVTTALEYVTAVNTASQLVVAIGTWVDSDVLASGDDEFSATGLSGGVDSTPAEVGRGAVVNTFAGRPVWDQYLDVDGTSLDSLQALTTLQDFGGLPYVAGKSEVPDWGRNIVLHGMLGLQWQWAKRFMDAVRGSWRAFWLATWRNDLIPVSVGAGTLTVLSGPESGDFFAWWPRQRMCLQVWQEDDAKTYARIAGATDNGNGTITLAIVDGGGSPVSLSGVVIKMVSWLERVRLDSDIMTVEFGGAEFTLQLTARVVQQAEV